MLEQLATRGALGLAAFVAMWFAAVRAVVRRRRSPREDVFAYAILGGLVAYFAQNLALFDTPATILVWAVLMAWVASQELTQEPAVAPASTGAPPRRAERRRGQVSRSLLASPWGLGGAALVIMALLGVSLAFLLNQRPYASAETVLDTLRPGLTWTQRLDLYQESFDNFPGLANRTRQALFEAVAPEWENLSSEERTQALRMVDTELERGLGAEPHNAILLHSAISLYHEAVAHTEDLDRIDPLLRQLSQLAPERPQTHQRLAIQAVLRGNPGQALAIIEAYLAKAPGTEPQFIPIREFAEEILESQAAS